VIYRLQELAEKKKVTDIDIQTLIDAGLVQKSDLVKILGNGELKTKLNVKAHAFSKTAQEAIEALQGTAEKI
jgi:large subunit ribosomal protein L15